MIYILFIVYLCVDSDSMFKYNMQKRIILMINHDKIALQDLSVLCFLKNQ